MTAIQTGASSYFHTSSFCGPPFSLFKNLCREKKNIDVERMETIFSGGESLPCGHNRNVNCEHNNWECLSSLTRCRHLPPSSCRRCILLSRRSRKDSRRKKRRTRVKVRRRPINPESELSLSQHTDGGKYRTAHGKVNSATSWKDSSSLERRKTTPYLPQCHTIALKKNGPNQFSSDLITTVSSSFSSLFYDIEILTYLFFRNIKMGRNIY